MALLSVPVFTVDARSADAGPSFEATSNAYGVDLTIANQTIPLGIVPEASGPTAQAHLNSLGNSDAFASLPYPGEIVASVPGLAGALTGGIPFPAYPFLAATQAGDPPTERNAPGISLHAESERNVASGKAVLGTDSVGYTAVARVSQAADDSVTASANTSFGVNLLGVIALNGIQSTVAVTADPSTGELTRTSHLAIGSISIPGLNMQLPVTTPGTVPLPIPLPGVPQLPPVNLPQIPILFGGQVLSTPDLGFEDGTFTITLPLLGGAQKFAVPAQVVLGALKAVGIRLSYQVAQATTTGVMAPVLTFGYTAPAPPSNKFVNGPTDFELALGRSTANVTLNPVESVGDTGSTGPVDVGLGGTTVGSGGDVGSTTGGTTGGTIGGSPSSGDLPVVVPGLTGNSGSGGSPPSSTGTRSPTTEHTAPVSMRVADRNAADMSGLYLICISIGAAILAGASVLRLLGVRVLWAS